MANSSLASRAIFLLLVTLALAWAAASVSPAAIAAPRATVPTSGHCGEGEVAHKAMPALFCAVHCLSLAPLATPLPGPALVVTTAFAIERDRRRLGTNPAFDPPPPRSHG